MHPVIYQWKGTRHLIRGAPTAILCWLVKRLQCGGTIERVFLDAEHNTPETIQAIARELLTRPDVTPYFQHCALALSGLTCSCGRPGLYIVGVRLYCRACRPQAVARRVKQNEYRDAGKTEFVENEKPALRAEKFHRLVQRDKNARSRRR